MRENPQPALHDSDEESRRLVAIIGSAGLRSKWDDPEWDYYGFRKRFKWTRRMANGLRLTHPENSSFWTLARRYQAALRSELVEDTENALSTIFAKTHALLAICDMVIRRGLSSLAEFDETHHQELMEEFNEGRTGFSPEKVTKGRLLFVHAVYADLHHLFAHPQKDGRYILNDGFRFPIILDKSDRIAIAKKGKVSGQTEDLPEAVVFAHIAAAIEYIEFYASDIMKLDRRWSEIRAKPAPKPTRARPGEATARVAELLHDAVIKGSHPELLAEHIVDRRVVSELAEVHHTSLYKLRFNALFEAVECYLNTPSDASHQRMRTALDAPILAFARVARKPPQRRAPTAEVGLPFKGVDGEFAPWPLNALGSTAGEDASLEEAKSDLWSACYILVLAYLAVRLDEGLSVTTDCIVPKVDGFYLRYRVTKNLNSEGGTVVERPVPEVVVKAVNIAIELGKDARLELKSDELFAVGHRLGASSLEESTVRKRLASFGRRTGASRRAPLVDGEEWIVTPNHLRRFFVTMWNNYYAYARKYEALRRFLGHEWITTTVRYGLRREDLPRLSEQQRDTAVKVLVRKFFDGAGSLSEIPKYIVAFAEGLRIRSLPPEQIFKYFREFVDDQKIILFAMPWGYCVWSASAGKYAQCFKKSLRAMNMDRGEAERTCVGCDGCQNLMRDEVFEPFYETGLERHTKIAENPKAPPSIVVAAKTFINIATSILKRAA